MAFLIHPGGEVEHEQILQRDDVALHARDLGHVRDAARAVLQPLLMHDELDGRRDLFTHGARGQIHPGHHRDGLQA